MKNAGLIKRNVFLGFVLNQYYLEREMLSLYQEGRSTWHATFSGGVKVVLNSSSETFEVTENGRTFATNEWAFVNVNDRIYAYSTVGGDVSGKLPDAWKNKKIIATATANPPLRPDPKPVDIEIENGVITVPVGKGQPVILKLADK